MPPTPGKIVTDRANGKREVRNASGKAAVYNASGGCDCCSPVMLDHFKFQTIGFLSHSSSTYYEYNALPSPFAWEVLAAGPTHYRAKVTFEGDWNCQHVNPNPQTARCVLDVRLAAPMVLTLDWEGLGENVPSGPYTSWDYDGNHGVGWPYPPERMFFTMGSSATVLASAHAPGIMLTPDDRYDNFGNPNAARCGEMAPVVSAAGTNPPRMFNLAAGSHHLAFDLGTGDELFHAGAYYILDVVFKTMPSSP